MASQSPGISIVTASFNQGAFIAEAIESVLAQGYSNIEHIIVDNCSADHTAQVLARYPHLKVICEPDRGQSDALNKGFKAATGDIIGWLNADDKYLPGCLEHVVRAFRDQPDSDLIYGDYRFVDARGNLIRTRRELSFDHFMLKYLHVLYIPTTSMFFRRKIFADGNFLDMGYHYAMDYEFFLRLAERGYCFGHIPQLLADFRWHSDSKSQTQARRQRDEMERALAERDPFLNRFTGFSKGFMRGLLMFLARSQRYSQKLYRGAYWR